MFLQIAKFTGKHLRQSLFFNKVASLRSATFNFIEKETLSLVFSCEFCQISRNTFFTEHLLVTASAVCKNMILRPFFLKNNLLGKVLKPPLFCSAFFWLKTYFFNEKNIDYSSSLIDKKQTKAGVDTLTKFEKLLQKEV